MRSVVKSRVRWEGRWRGKQNTRRPDQCSAPPSTSNFQLPRFRQVAGSQDSCPQRGSWVLDTESASHQVSCFYTLRLQKESLHRLLPFSSVLSLKHYKVTNCLCKEKPDSRDSVHKVWSPVGDVWPGPPFLPRSTAGTPRTHHSTSNPSPT